MAPIETYVFLDLETTGVPKMDHNKTRITELSMLVVKREHIKETKPGVLPRVQSKLTMCFNPGRMIEQGATDASGLDNYLLEHETMFNMNVFNTINSFLECLQRPVCLVAENGHSFDFPILKNHIEKLNVAFNDDIMCADSLHAFFDILDKECGNGTAKSTNSEIKVNSEISTDSIVEKLNDSSDMANLSINKTISEVETTICDVSELDCSLTMQKENETTPKRNIKTKAPKNIKDVRRKLYFKKDNRRIVPRPNKSYKLKCIYERVLGRPAVDAHRAEYDCMMTAEIAVAKVQEFIEWVDENHCPFSEVKAMKPGVPLDV